MANKQIDTLEPAKIYFIEKGYRVYYRNYFTIQEGLLIITPIGTEGKIKYFERSVFIYRDDTDRWFVRTTPHGQEHSLLEYNTLMAAVKAAEKKLNSLKE